ncbi:MAG: TPM domain-containing protein [Thermoleophilia bacterium]|nr:TPM domain-containing protein [Thermoleophilia bacterium]
MAATAALVATFVLMAVLLLPAGSALAEDPFRLDTQIEDRSGALGGRQAEVQTALDELRESERVDLWVVYVDTFSGLDSEEWALQTADLSDLGLNDALLAVAVEDRSYYYVVDEDFPLNDDELDEVMSRSVEPALRDNDWAGAAVGAAVGISEALSPVVVTTVTTSAPATTAAGGAGGSQSGGSGEVGEDGGFPWGVVVALVVLAIVGVIIWARLWNSRKGTGAKGIPAGGKAERAMTLQELRQRVGSQLVQTDDAIKTSTEEVGFAIAEFGEAEAAPFEKALEGAHRELDEAFKLHRQLDENADGQTQRLLLTAILQHTGAANAVLDAQVKHFDKLRDLEKQAPQVLAALEQQVTALEARIPSVREELTALAAVYSPKALTSVAANPDEAASRLMFVREQMKAGLEDVAAKRLGEAAVTALAAQEAAGQAQAFLDAVGRIGKDLAEAQGRIDAAIVETQRDIAEAQAAGKAGSLGAAAAQLGPLVATAQAAVAAASGAASPEGGRDPLTALRHLEEADTALESALQQVRDERTQRAKAAVALDRTLIAARAQVSAAADYITTHRGAVGAQPRELLAEAQGALDQALALGAADPVGATRWAANAHELASRALNQAESETQRATTVGIPGMPGAPGTDMGSAVIGAILGGILTSALGGGSSSRRGGSIFGSGWSGGPSGGRRGGGGFAPPSFGGTSTRMRRGGGGRF